MCGFSKISNFDKRTAKHLPQASCTELTLGFEYGIIYVCSLICFIRFVWLNLKFLIYILIGSNLFQISGPLLLKPLYGHSMVRLGKGQAILGGKSNNDHQTNIYMMTCSNRHCFISLLNRKLSVAREFFVAIPIPDEISVCLTGGKTGFQKSQNFYITKHLFHP